MSAPIFGFPDVTAGDFKIDAKASNNDAIGALLSQIQNGREIVISYGSRVLNNSERNYCLIGKNAGRCVFWSTH